jgi:hypothetical protein
VRPPLAPLAAALCAACSYDLDVLRGRDGGTDVPRTDVATDLPRAEAAVDVATDLPRAEAAVDVATDLPPTRDASVGTCMGRTPINLAPETPGVINVGEVLTIEGSTVGGEATISNCGSTTPAPMSTRVYRYRVRNGPRLVATTNTGLCGAAHDTILAAYFNCDGTGLVPGPRSCVDDDAVNVCEGMATCASDTSRGCGTVFSTLELSGLAPGDVVYLAVSSYPTMGPMMPPQRGPFRLSVAENGLSPAPPPPPSLTPPAANRCVCPPSTTPPAMWARRTVEFPRSPSATNQLMTSTRSVFANLPVGLAQVWGVSGKLQLSAFNVSTAGTCATSGGATAALDVIVGGTAVVASVTLGVYVGQASTVTIPLTTFAPLPFSAGSTNFTYRLRNVQPADANCVSVNIDLNAANELTLYGAM